MNTQKQAASFEEVTATGALLANEADSLKNSTARFKTGADVVSLSEAPGPTDNAPASVVKKDTAKIPPVGSNLAEDLSGWDEF